MLLFESRKNVVENSKLSDILAILINEGLHQEGAPLHGFPKINCIDALYLITCKLPKTKLFREKEKIIRFCINLSESVGSAEQSAAFSKANSIIQKIAYRYFENNEYGTIFITIIKIFDELEWRKESQCFSVLFNLLETSEGMSHLKERIFLGLFDKILVYISGKMPKGPDEVAIAPTQKMGETELPQSIQTKKEVRLTVLKFLYQMLKKSTSEFVSFLYLDVISDSRFKSQP